MDLDLSAYDGIALQVEGDGQTYKLNLKTADQENVPEDTFQATFDTVAGLLFDHMAAPPPWLQCLSFTELRASSDTGAGHSGC